MTCKFNIIAKIHNFTDVMNNFGNFMSPSRFRHHNTNKSESYIVYNVCDETYKVIIEDDQVTVYEIEEDDRVIIWKPNPSKFIAKDIFLDDYNSMRAILLHLDDNCYVFIGFKMYTFLALHKITNFASIIEFTFYQKSFYHPYAIDEYNNIYLFLESVILNANMDILSRIMEYRGVYDFYYKIGHQYSSNMILDKTIT